MTVVLADLAGFVVDWNWQRCAGNSTSHQVAPAAAYGAGSAPGGRAAATSYGCAAVPAAWRSALRSATIWASWPGWSRLTGMKPWNLAARRSGLGLP
jgi:hypothetical protein